MIEAHVLSILLRRPDILYQIDRALQNASLGHLSVDDFGYTDHQILFRLVRQSLEQDASDPDHFLLDHLPDALEGLMNSLVAQSEKLDPLDDRMIEDLFRGIIAMRRRMEDDAINQLRFLQEEAQGQGDLRAGAYGELVTQHILARGMLDQAKLKENGARK
jgi:hypothetical protein